MVLQSTPPHPSCLHTHDDKTMFFTCSRHGQSQSRELMQIDARTWLQAPNAEKSPRVGTLTPADGIQVPQSPAATHRPGQRAVPPGDWPGSMLDGGQKAEVREAHPQGLQAWEHLAMFPRNSLPESIPSSRHPRKEVPGEGASAWVKRYPVDILFLE